MKAEYKFKSWEQFKRDYFGQLSVSKNLMIEQFVFRGQADAGWGIESSFDRACPSNVSDLNAYYERLLKFFCYQVRQYGEDLDGLTRQERGSVAQHYGMPTRLIDWSKSPYVAAFMAFYAALTEGRCGIGKRVAIWAMDVERFEMISGETFSPFKIVRTRVLQNDRVWRQAGLFVEAVGNEKSMDRYLAKCANGGDCGLTKFTLPTSEASTALNDLILMGLTPATIYPDRDGAAKYVRLRLALEASNP